MICLARLASPKAAAAAALRAGGIVLELVQVPIVAAQKEAPVARAAHFANQQRVGGHAVLVACARGNEWQQNTKLGAGFVSASSTVQ